MGFILSDLSRDSSGFPIASERVHPWAKKHSGKVYAGFPMKDQYSKLNYTGKLGSVSGIYYGLCFQLGKLDYKLMKIDEHIEVSPVHQQYYQLTHKQKEDLETRIKQGLQSVGQTVSDVELLNHDLRKYDEFAEYLGLEWNSGKQELEKKSEPDEHSLKAIFIDQVDYHVGGGGEGPGRLSMSFMQQKNIMPTIVQDFLDMNSESDLDTSERLSNIPTVEKNMLRTKWRAYIQWKRMFEENIIQRYKRIKTMMIARETSLEQYKEWLKPYIARHKLLAEGLGSEGGRKGIKGSFYDSPTHGVSSNTIILWIWKDIAPDELHKPPGESIAHVNMMKYPAFDEFMQRELIWHPENGLISDFPWLTEKWVEDTAKELKSQYSERDLYYSFFELKLNRSNMKMADGKDLEDGDFYINPLFLSKNALLAKLMEGKAKQEEFERYVNRLLGTDYQDTDVDQHKLLNRIKTATKDLDEEIKRISRNYDRRISVFKSKLSREDKDSRKESLNNKIKSLEKTKENKIKSLEKKKASVEEKIMKMHEKGKLRDVRSDEFSFYKNNFLENLKYFGHQFMFSKVVDAFKPSPYEKASNLKDRMTKFYLKEMGGGRTGQIRGIILDKMGVGD